MRPNLMILGLSAALLCGCALGTTPGGTKDDALPAMRWDHRPEAQIWTQSTMSAVARHDEKLAEVVPADIGTWCPGYATGSIEDRRAFWVGLLSATAKHESTWNPKAVGGGGAYIGLMQISPGTARAYNCTADSASELKDGTENLACAVEIVARQVDRDGMVAGNGNRGIARDWGPFTKSSKRQEMAAWTRVQTYCQ